MAIQCSNCGTEVGEGVKFCPNCGTAVHAAAPPGEAISPPPPGSQPTVPQPTAQPTVPQPVTPATDPGYAAPPPAGGGYDSSGTTGGGGPLGTTSGKIAAVVGALVILGGVFAGVKLLTRDSSPKPTKPVRNVTQPTTQPTSQPTPQETTQPTGAPTPAPDSGSLADLVEDPVGKWSAQDVQDSPDIAANWGANDALTVTYASGKGGLTFVIAAYASPEDAETAVPQLAQSVVDSLGYRVVNQDDVQGQDGSHLGQVILLEGDDEVVLWSNGSYVRWAEGPRGASVDFYGHSSF